MPKRGPVVLIILDGWGFSDTKTHNAIAKAVTPQWDSWWQQCPHRLLNASGLEVGLPDGQMGNSEVGHMHLGAGREVLQDFTFINQSIKNKQFFKNDTLLSLIDHQKASHKRIHVMGLLSTGGIHSHQDHLFAFLDLCDAQHYVDVCLHLFLDGRDTPPKNAQQSIQNLTRLHPKALIKSISGRYWAMDRDQRWPRTQQVYELIALAKSEHHESSAEEAIASYYRQDITDEFIPPTLIGEPSPMQDGDALFFFNFRADRAKQLTEAFVADTMTHFNRPRHPKLSSFVSMTPYDASLPTEPVFAKRTLKNTFGEIVANKGLKQLRLAETEKYAHVTYFFNGGLEQPFAREDRCLVPSPKVATYDLKPEMSAEAVTQKLVEAIEKQQYDVIICNYANADMVGHSGDMNATIHAIEALDKALHQVGKALLDAHGEMLITADHGNADCMFDEQTQQAHTAHTLAPVPLLYVGTQTRGFKTGPASLKDIAPTLLNLLDIDVPSEMTGQILWE